jgi:hypothetical protein
LPSAVPRSREGNPWHEICSSHVSANPARQGSPTGSARRSRVRTMICSPGRLRIGLRQGGPDRHRSCHARVQRNQSTLSPEQPKLWHPPCRTRRETSRNHLFPTPGSSTYQRSLMTRRSAPSSWALPILTIPVYVLFDCLHAPHFLLAPTKPEFSPDRSTSEESLSPDPLSNPGNRPSGSALLSS